MSQEKSTFTTDLLQGIEHLGQASLKLTGDKIIYLDPFRIEGEPSDADIVFCTHDHFDHLSPADIKKVVKLDSVLVVPQKNVKNFKKMQLKGVIGVEPGKDYEIDGISFQTVPSYNLKKKFHKKKFEWVGYIIHWKGARYYFAGDTDYIPEMDDIEADVVFLPVGGTYTMDATEASQAANSINPKVAVPIHFGSLVGTKNDAEQFIENLNDGIEGTILLKI